MYNFRLFQQGVSLLETLVCLALLMSLSIASAPAMTRLFNSSLINSERTALTQDIRLLRRYAILRQRNGYLCAIDASGQCTDTANWADGWVGFIDKNNNHNIDPSDELVLEHTGIKGKKLEIFLHARWQRLKFDIDGVLRSSGHFRICDPSRQGIQDMQVIRMNVHGRLAVEDDKLLCN